MQPFCNETHDAMQQKHKMRSFFIRHVRNNGLLLQWMLSDAVSTVELRRW